MTDDWYFQVHSWEIRIPNLEPTLINTQPAETMYQWEQNCQTLHFSPANRNCVTTKMKSTYLTLLCLLSLYIYVDSCGSGQLLTDAGSVATILGTFVALGVLLFYPVEVYPSSCKRDHYQVRWNYCQTQIMNLTFKAWTMLQFAKLFSVA